MVPSRLGYMYIKNSRLHSSVYSVCTVYCVMVLENILDLFYIYPFHQIQVVSLSGNGELVWWVVVQQKASTRVTSDDVEVDISPYAGATPWSKIVINNAYSTTVTSLNR